MSHVRGGVDNGRTLSKDKWCDGLLFVAQDECMRERLRFNRAVTRLAELGFVKVTCSRSGAFARDWADRAEKQARAASGRMNAATRELSVAYVAPPREGLNLF